MGLGPLCPSRFVIAALARVRVYVRPKASRNRYYVPCFPVGAKRPTEMGCRAKVVGEATS